ncbi:MAG: substrate-binding domain-containing protein [Polaromonas sp.]
MPHLKARALLLALLIFPVMGSAGPLEGDSRIRIGGTGGALASLQLLGEAFKKVQPTVSIVTVPSLGSSGGINAMLASAIDLAVSSRPLKEAERGQGATATDYARTPVVFATAARFGTSAITTGELVGIYAGEVTTWPDGRTLRLVLRPESESDTDIVKSLSPAMNQAVKSALARQGMIIASTDKVNADHLEKIHGAIGAITLSQIITEKRALLPLALNGVMPSLQTLDNGSYPYAKTFSLITTPKASLQARQFVAFVRSPEARQILEKSGQSQVPGK